MKENKVSLFAALILIIGLATACDSDKLYEKNTPIANEMWSRFEIISFDVDIPDTNTPYDVYINVRHNTNYKYSNLYLFMNTLHPDSLFSRDTIECVLADNTGKWYGEGSGKYRFAQVLLGQNVRFPQQGNYVFEIEQAMRHDSLPDISDIGLRIEKSKPLKNEQN